MGLYLQMKVLGYLFWWRLGRKDCIRSIV